ncbi:hypothetical protein Ciccas_009048 [Cichlidogyrus casuarinus]|uniref:Uncharacterized protein n=1 Tax=Cichlidogyrus casuarinus TaxID=1844966 RepID=A0ABD2PZ38_9PLAT
METYDGALDENTLKGYHIFDFKWVKLLVTQCITLSTITIIFGAISLGWHDWLYLEPPTSFRAPANAANAQKFEAYNRNVGLFFYCFNDKGALGLRSSQVGMHASGLLLFILFTFMTVGLICIWLRDQEDNDYYRGIRLILGIGFTVSAFALLISILLWHISQDFQKRLVSNYVKETFPNWDSIAQKGTKRSLGIGYAFIWVSTLLAFITAWCMLFSTCCWSYPSNVKEDPYDLTGSHLGHNNKGFACSKVSNEEQEQEQKQDYHKKPPSEAPTRGLADMFKDDSEEPELYCCCLKCPVLGRGRGKNKDSEFYDDLNKLLKLYTTYEMMKKKMAFE